MTQARIQTFFTGCCHAQLELQEVPETWNTTSFGRQIPAAPTLLLIIPMRRVCYTIA